jgi:putative heme-binding domain-containing protein
LTIVRLKDGRTVTGFVDNRTATTLTLKLMADSTTVALADVQSTELSSSSIMPDGLLESLSPMQRRDLVGYLMSNAQVPLPIR